MKRDQIMPALDRVKPVGSTQMQGLALFYHYLLLVIKCVFNYGLSQVWVHLSP